MKENGRVCVLPQAGGALRKSRRKDLPVININTPSSRILQIALILLSSFFLAGLFIIDYNWKDFIITAFTFPPQKECHFPSFEHTPSSVSSQRLFSSPALSVRWLAVLTGIRETRL